ncbi:MAG: endonuclease/exonuclease/phosphatase family protein [Thermotogaceae bacterium]|nr:endonuclease/exonuclease/phosphatase family protein [Thermotogaceae bacterium]
MDILKIVGVVLLTGLLAFAGLVAYLTATDYNPPEVVRLSSEGESLKATPEKLSILTWNIGYAGLGKNMDFFFDGGKHVKGTKENTVKNLEKISEFLNAMRSSVDIFLIQEIDIDSDRTYRINEYKKLKETLKGYMSAFAFNYHVDFVPVPYTSPMGRVRSGLAVFSKYQFYNPVRIALPGQYPWPESVAMLDRCLIKIYIPAPNGKKLVIYNTHNSAYDEEGKLRKLQLSFIKEEALKEYEKGNYVIVGGDWNSILDDDLNFKYTEKPEDFYVPLPDNRLPKGWKLYYDKNVPTNRSVAALYKENETFVTIIDGFLVSPNVKVLKVKGFDLGFENSDHNPVMITVETSHK